MKTISISTGRLEFPTPYKLVMYLFAVTALSLLNWTALRASDNLNDEAAMLQSRLADALEPAADPQFEIEGWMLTLSHDLLDGKSQATGSLEDRLTQALVPVAETEPALEDWLLTFSDSMLGKNAASRSELEIRLAEALEPIADPAPALEKWMFNISDAILEEGC